jgi:hypothetical protein
VGQEASGFLSLSLSCCFVYINVFIYPHIHSLSLWCLTLGDLGGWLHGVRRKRRNGRVTIQLQVSQPGPFFFSFFLGWFSVCVYFLFFPSHLLQILPFHRHIFVRVEIYSFSFFFLVVVANRKKNEGFSYGKCDVTFVRDTACNAPV